MSGVEASSHSSNHLPAFKQWCKDPKQCIIDTNTVLTSAEVAGSAGQHGQDAHLSGHAVSLVTGAAVLLVAVDGTGVCCGANNKRRQVMVW